MIKHSCLKQIGEEILNYEPDPIPRFLIIRDLLNYSPNNHFYQEAYHKIESNPLILAIINTQQSEGGWDRFHSMNSAKSHLPTTEFAIRRLVVLGLQNNNQALVKAKNYLINLYNHKWKFPDPPEKNDRWSIGKKLFISSTLSLIDPGNPVVSEEMNLWFKILEHSFISGSYNKKNEVLAHQKLTGLQADIRYLSINSMYHLELYSSRHERIDNDLQIQFIKWIWQHNIGVMYQNIPISSEYHKLSNSQLDRWMRSMELISKFPTWRHFDKVETVLTSI